jgi:uncharacterized membrane protein YfcA
MDWIAVNSGFAVGAIVGLTGVGGGSLMTPLLIGIFKLNPAVAIGTDLWFAALTKSGGAVDPHRQGHVDRGVTSLLLIGSLPAAAATIAWMHLNGVTKAWSNLLTLSLGIALLLTAVVVANRPAWQKLGLKLERLIPASYKPALTVAAGALGATLSLLLYPRLPTQQIVGTDIACAVPLTPVAGIGHATLGHVERALLAALLIGSLPGIWLGARLTQSLPDKLIRSLLAGSLLMAGLKVMH